jgi:hypothetical protein
LNTAERCETSSGGVVGAGGEIVLEALVAVEFMGQAAAGQLLVEHNALVVRHGLVVHAVE